MNLHEYQAKQVFALYWMPVPESPSLALETMRNGQLVERRFR